jgi:SAM-dependent methyltransferase
MNSETVVIDPLTYFFELYEGLPRGGPGSPASTERAFRMLPGLPPSPVIFDLGCGPGPQTLALARLAPQARIVAVDNHRPFLDRLEAAIAAAGFSERIEVREADMTRMEAPAGGADVVWSEGALYFCGFDSGLRRCRRWLRPGGCLAASEAVWLKADPPREVREMWMNEYPAIKPVADNLPQFAASGYELLGHFTIPESDWLDEFYLPMERRIAKLRARHQDNKDALAVLDSCGREIEIYKTYSDYYGYEFFVARAI